MGLNFESVNFHNIQWSSQGPTYNTYITYKIGLSLSPILKFL
jgi:hypothetical protein